MIWQSFPSFCQYNTRPARNIYLRCYVLWLSLEGERSAHEKSHLHEVLPAIPFHWVCEKLALQHNVIESSKASIITAEHNSILATILDTDTIISETLGGVEVEDEKQSRALVNDNLIGFVL